MHSAFSRSLELFLKINVNLRPVTGVFCMSKKTAALILMMLFGAESFSAPATVQSLIRSKYNQNVSLETQFDMHIWWSVRERDEKKSGKLYIAPGDRFRVELESETVVSDGKSFWQYSEKSAQVIIKNLQDLDLSFHPSRLFSTYLSEYSFTEKQNDGSTAVLSWKADSTASKAPWSAIEVHASVKNGTVSELKLTDSSGNVYTYKFRKTVFNPKIPGKVFKFEVPGNAQVHDSRK